MKISKKFNKKQIFFICKENLHWTQSNKKMYLTDTCSKFTYNLLDFSLTHHFITYKYI